MQDAVCLFYPSVNYLPDRVTAAGQVVREVADNDYQTFSTLKNFVLNVQRNHLPTKITHIYIKTQGVDGYVVAGSHRRVMNPDFSRFGFQHDLFELPEVLYADEVNIQFLGTDVKIYEVMALELGIYFLNHKRFVSERHSKIETAGGLRTDTQGKLTHYRRRGATRWAWRSAYNCLFEDNAYDTFFLWLERNPVFMFTPGVGLYPNRLYPATHLQFAYTAEPRSEVKTAGVTSEFVIQEYTGQLQTHITSQNNSPPDPDTDPERDFIPDGLRVFSINNKTYVIDRKVFGIPIPRGARA